ncbi:MAG: site-2 protease family protein [Clostridia bacterium]|nr:site-2 protease family protein [Clostridia bacterium]
MLLLYILVAILMFGSLIFIHELGHFLTARLFQVKIYEFAIGMGPKLISWKSKKNDTAYSLRMFPIGGFVSMAGEDEESDDEGSLRNKKVWQRIIITAAGSVFNLLIGLIVMFFIVVFSANIGSTKVSAFPEGALSVQTETKDGLLANDEILAINGKKVHVFYDMNYKISRYGAEPVDITVLRDGKEITLENIVFPTQIEQGVTFGMRDFYVHLEEKNLGIILKTTYYQSVYTVRMVYDSLYDLITGKFGIQQMSGPVGITNVITDAAQDAVETKDGSYLFMLFVVLAMNLGCMNLLPFPALDGGRIVFLAIEGIRRKPLDARIEGYIHFVGMALLLLLMLIITFKDIFTLIIR